jgi:hypothetical protein
MTFSTTITTTATTIRVRSTWRIHAIAFVAFGLLLGACQEKTDGDGPNGASAKKQPPAVVIPQRSRAGMDTSSRPGYYPPSDGPVTGDPNVRPDTSDGKLTVVGSGAASGKWIFYDATASLDEFTRAGVTTSSLQIEGHRINPVMNFKIRVMTDDGAVTAGVWDLTDQNPIRRVDVVWDNDNIYYRGLSGAKGKVTITKIDAGNVSGSYNVTLPPVQTTGGPQTLTGVFAMGIAR